MLDYDAQGELVGMEFLGVRRGVDLRDLPHPDKLAGYFGEHEIPVFA
jgi:hypothetical protein